MKAAETKLQPIIEGTKQYVVPLFQRPYSWETKHWNILWEDLLQVCGEKQRPTHFMGSIVTMPFQSVPEGVSKFLLIDGQQRLITIFLLLSLLRDKAKVQSGPELAREIEQMLLINPFKRGNDTYKLLPTQTQRDREAFTRIIQGEPDAQESQILRAYKFFDKQLRLQPGLDLETLKNAIVNKLSVVSIVLDKEDNAFLIFESLNAKGQPLSQGDLIRNYFLMRIHVDRQEKLYEDNWQPMQERLGKDLTPFIRHFLMRDGSVIREGDVYFALKQQADGKSQDEVVAYLEEIANFSKYYARLIDPEKEPSTMLRRGLRRLNQIEVTTAYPFLLNVYHDYAADRTSEPEFVAIVELLENFMIRRFICGVPTHGLNKYYPSLYEQARQNASLLDGVRDALKTQSYPRDSEFRERLMATKVYGGDRYNKAKLILETLEESFEHREPTSFTNMTVEHVMPQTLTDWWRAHLGEDCETIHELLVHTLGNLTLSGYNAELSNSEFSQKQNLLRDSHLELNKYFGTVREWNESAIRKRAEELAKRAMDIWGFFGTAQEEGVPSPQDVTGTSPAAVFILGERIPVSYWREVLQKTMETIAELDEEKFEELLEEFPKFVSRSDASLRKSRKMKNGAFIETNLSANAIYKFCLQATSSIGLTLSDWRIELKEGAASRTTEGDNVEAE